MLFLGTARTMFHDMHRQEMENRRGAAAGVPSSLLARYRRELGHIISLAGHPWQGTSPTCPYMPEQIISTDRASAKPTAMLPPRMIIVGEMVG